MPTSTIATATMPPGPPRVPGPLYRMTVEEYEAAAATGVFGDRAPFHLINGYLVEKMTVNPPHAIAVVLLAGRLGRIVPAGWHVRSDLPARFPGEASEPEPDGCVARGTPRDYLAGHPGPGDIALVVEIADSSLAEDRRYGRDIYGPAGVPAYWIVNLTDRRVEVHTGPGPAGYASRVDYGPGQDIPVVIDGREVGRIAVDELLP